jgi:hypothetical protein
LNFSQPPKSMQFYSSIFFGTVELAWIFFAIEKLKTYDKSLMTCIWSKLFLLQIQIPGFEFPSFFCNTYFLKPLNNSIVIYSGFDKILNK